MEYDIDVKSQYTQCQELSLYFQILILIDEFNPYKKDEKAYSFTLAYQ